MLRKARHSSMLLPPLSEAGAQRVKDAPPMPEQVTGDPGAVTTVYRLQDRKWERLGPPVEDDEIPPEAA